MCLDKFNVLLIKISKRQAEGKCESFSDELLVDGTKMKWLIELIK